MANLSGIAITLNGNVQNVGAAVSTYLPAQCVIVRSAKLQAGQGNTGTIYIGSAAVAGSTDAWAMIGTTDTVDLGGGSDSSFINLDSVYVKGTNNEKLLVSVLP